MKILHVEDSDMDAELIQLIVGTLNYPDLYIRATDGEMAVSLLDEEFDLVLLDLNLPKAHGLDVLKEIRRSEKNERTPVIVFSSSFADTDVRRSLRAGANAYVVKPNDARGFRSFVDSLHSFWRHHRR